MLHPSIHRVTTAWWESCMDCMTTAWLMVLSHKGSLILHCVTVAAATPSLHTQSWKRFLPGVSVWTAWRLRDWCCCAYCLYCIATAWLMQLSHVQRPMSGGSGHASADTGLRDCWWCLTESAAAGCLIVLYCLDCVTGGAVARTGAIWSECVTTAWLMLRPHPACTSSLI